MTPPHAAASRAGYPRSTARRAARLGAAFALALALVVPLLPSSLASPVAAVAPANDYVNVTATSTLSFVPSSFAVTPGATVHLRVTQAANFEHTFTLSSVANTTVSSVGWFSTHPPLVNLSLGSTAGAVFTATFTAPAVGSYEYVCEAHFPTMKGTMTSSASAPPPGAGSSGAPIPIGWVAGGAVVALLAVAGVLLLWKHRRDRRTEMRYLGLEERRKAP